MNRARRAPRHYQTTVRGACEGRHRALNLTGVSHVERAHLHAKRRRHSLDDAELSVPGRIGGVAKDSRARRAWCDLLEHLQPFPAQTVFEQQKAGGVAAWSGQAINEAAADRIDSSREHDWH